MFSPLFTNNHVLKNDNNRVYKLFKVYIIRFIGVHYLSRIIISQKRLTLEHVSISPYFSQITELTSQVASLEIQMKQGYSQSDRINTELKQMKDLCLKLDHEKDELRHELRNRDDQRLMVSKLNIFNLIKGSQVTVNIHVFIGRSIY